MRCSVVLVHSEHSNLVKGKFLPYLLFFKIISRSTIVNSQVTFSSNGVFGDMGYTAFADNRSTFILPSAASAQLADIANNNFYPKSGSALLNKGENKWTFFIFFDC